jgi:hypothetical protein
MLLPHRILPKSCNFWNCHRNVVFLPSSHSHSTEMLVLRARRIPRLPELCQDKVVLIDRADPCKRRTVKARVQPSARPVAGKNEK